MIPNPWILLAAAVAFMAAVAAAFGTGHKFGFAEANSESQAKEAKRVDKFIERVKIVNVEVPKIVTKTVTQEVQVTKEVERVVTVAGHMLDPDCVLPGDFGMLLVAAANGLDPTAGDVAQITGTYGCRETLEATLSDLRAGWINSARLEGLQRAARVVTTGATQ